MKATVFPRHEWARFRSRGRLIALAVAVPLIILFEVLPGLTSWNSCSEGPVEVPCPTEPRGPDGREISDKFYFVHRPLGRNGSITVRLTSLTGIITYPPPDHDKLVPGVVPWAKGGVIIKDGTRQGSSYAALMVTGDHGVRMQYDYVHDTAGRSGGVSARSPRWLRLTRSGDTITGHESPDGTRWTQVGAARLPGLPPTALIGMFAASPGDLTLRRTGLGARLPESRFTQATAVFDSVRVEGAPVAGWSGGPVGKLGETDWEKYHRAPGLVESGGTFTISGSGDIGPIPEGGSPESRFLLGLPLALIIIITTATRFATTPARRNSAARPLPAREAKDGPTPADQPAMSRPQPPAAAAREVGGGLVGDGGSLVRRSLVVGVAAGLVGLVSAAVALPVGVALAPSGGSGFSVIDAGVVVGVAVLTGVAAVLAFAFAALVRRPVVAPLSVTALLVLPYVVSVVPLLPDEVTRWLLRVTPAAAFAVQQTATEYPQAVAYYAPMNGYFPLPGWAGLAVLCAYAAVVLTLAASRHRTS
ncbi:hypothetical protein [Spongiactinospora sp. TRM90649]|uniref:hypothetical protein n=1 Tax=Spongiactinospora sp. TRM90649 TaxID=3031114 RepID=UPI0023F61C66|nr:hypothetical protein [Spongiactinospora sp. TRM90649]MDF5752718.1 hypothetical protein [Spongiactinospora sp. TRM90649]